MKTSVTVRPGMAPSHGHRAAVLGAEAVACSLLVFALVFIGLLLLAVTAGPFPYGTVGSPT
jgi:hypothetical protein